MEHGYPLAVSVLHAEDVEIETKLPHS